MAVLFSGAGQQLGEEAKQLGQTIFKGALSIYEHLDRAEQVSQFNVGQLKLQSAMNQYDYERTTNDGADFLQWQVNNSETMTKAWDDVEKSLANQGAKNMLHDWWQGQKVSRSRMIEDEIIGRRIDQVVQSYEKTRTSIKENTAWTADEKATKLTENGKQYTGVGIIHSEKANIDLVADVHGIYKDDFETRMLNKLTNGEDEEEVFKWGLDPKNSPMINDTDRKIGADATISAYKVLNSIQDKKATANNLKIKGGFIDRIFQGEDLPSISEISSAKWASSANVEPVSDKEHLYSLLDKKVKEMTNGDLWDSWQSSPEKSQDVADSLMQELRFRTHTPGQTTALRNFMKVSDPKADIVAPVLSDWGDLGAEGRTIEAKDLAIKKFIEKNPSANSAQISRILSLPTTPIKGNLEEDKARIANDGIVEEFQHMVLSGTMPDTKKEAYDQVDQKKWVKAGKITQKNWVTQAQSLVDAYYREKDAYTQRTRKMTNAEKDDQLWKYAQPFLEGRASGSDEDIDKVMSTVDNLHGKNGIDMDTLDRFRSRITSMSKLTENDRAELKILAVMPGDPNEIRSASAKAFADMAVWIKKNPQEASKAGAIKSRAEAMKEVELSPIINKGLESLSTGEKWLGSRIWNDVFPTGKTEMLQMGKLMMNGDVETAANSGSLDSISFLRTLNDSSLASLKDVTGMKGDPWVKKDKNGDIQPTRKSEFETIGGVPRKGQYPLSEMASPDKNTYYQLWMNDHAELLWYAIPKASYVANRDDWKLLK